jgi:hypothetical protein
MRSLVAALARRLTANRRKRTPTRAVLGCGRALLKLEVLEARTLPSTFFVSTAGNDKNDGRTPASAWKTITKVDQTAFHAGDVVLFQGGGAFQGNLRFSSGGTATAPITISSYGTLRATIDAGAGSGLAVHNAGGFAIKNLNFVGAGNNNTNGISFDNNLPGDVKLPHVYIDHVDIRGFGANGIDVLGLTGKDGYDDVRITYVTSHGNGLAGVYIEGQVPSVSNSRVYIGHCQAYNDNLGGLEIADTDGGTIERSVAHDNAAGVGHEVGIWTYDSNSVTIQYNESYRNFSVSGSDEGDGFDLDGGVTNSIMQYNYSHENDGAGYLLGEYPGAGLTGGNLIRFNISQNDGRLNGYGGIYVYNYDYPYSKVTNNYIYNNTVYNSVGSAAVVINGSLPASSNIFANNIFQTAGGVPLILDYSNSGATFVGNDYWTSGGAFLIRYHGARITSLAAFHAAGQETLNGMPTGYNIDPKLQNPGKGGTIGNADKLSTLSAYLLDSTSGLLNVGLNLKSHFGVSSGQVNFYGKQIPPSGPFDIGAD